MRNWDSSKSFITFLLFHHLAQNIFLCLFNSMCLSTCEIFFFFFSCLLANFFVCLRILTFLQSKKILCTYTLSQALCSSTLSQALCSSTIFSEAEDNITECPNMKKNIHPYIEPILTIQTNGSLNFYGIPSLLLCKPFMPKEKKNALDLNIHLKSLYNLQNARNNISIEKSRRVTLSPSESNIFDVYIYTQFGCGAPDHGTAGRPPRHNFQFWANNKSEILDAPDYDINTNTIWNRSRRKKQYEENIDNNLLKFKKRFLS